MKYPRHSTLAAWLIATVLASSFAYGAPATVDDATKAQLKLATEHYERGVAAMDTEKYEDALKAFQTSYDTVSSPNSRLMIGRVLAKMGKLPEAYRELELTFQQASTLASTQKKYQKTVDTSRKELDDIKKQLAFVRVTQGAKLKLQGEPVELENWQTLMPVLPGTVSVEVTFANGSKTRKSLTLKAGDIGAVALDELKQPAAAVGPVATTTTARAENSTVNANKTLDRRTVGYVVGGVGVIGLGLFVGYGLMGASSIGDPKGSCSAGNCPEGSVDDAGAKALRQGIGYTTLGIGVLGVGIGTWLIVTGGKSSPSTALHLAPGGVQVFHRF
jgi:hypothetical protein